MRIVRQEALVFGHKHKSQAILSSTQRERRVGRENESDDDLALKGESTPSSFETGNDLGDCYWGGDLSHYTRKHVSPKRDEQLEVTSRLTTRDPTTEGLAPR